MTESPSTAISDLEQHFHRRDQQFFPYPQLTFLDNDDEVQTFIEVLSRELPHALCIRIKESLQLVIQYPRNRPIPDIPSALEVWQSVWRVLQDDLKCSLTPPRIKKNSGRDISEERILAYIRQAKLTYHHKLAPLWRALRITQLRENTSTEQYVSDIIASNDDREQFFEQLRMQQQYLDSKQKEIRIQLVSLFRQLSEKVTQDNRYLHTWHPVQSKFFPAVSSHETAFPDRTTVKLNGLLTSVVVTSTAGVIQAVLKSEDSRTHMVNDASDPLSLERGGNVAINAENASLSQSCGVHFSAMSGSEITQRLNAPFENILLSVSGTGINIAIAKLKSPRASILVLGRDLDGTISFDDDSDDDEMWGPFFDDDDDDDDGPNLRPSSSPSDMHIQQN
jgi:hypothetical protein